MMFKSFTARITVLLCYYCRCKQTELIATLPIGYADGYLRNMSGVGSLTTVDGKMICTIISLTHEIQQLNMAF